MEYNDPLAVLNLYDKQSEEVLLAAVLKDDRLAEQIIPRVQMAMFSDLPRQYIYGAAAELHRHGHAVTADGVIAKSRELAGKAKLRKRDFVTKQQVERLLAVNIEGVDVVARATTVADIWSLRTYADGIGRLVDMIAQRPDPKEFRGELMGLLSSVSQGRAAQEDGIFYGFDASARMNEMLDRLEAGLFVRWSWPWRAFDFVAPLPPGFCAVWGMVDGAGKCLKNGAKVLMYDGSLRAVEDVALGDLLMGPDSTPRRVLEISRGSAPLYRVRQKRGIEYYCTGNHLLSVWQFTHGKKRQRTVRADYLAGLSPASVRSSFQGYKVAVEWPERATALDPYFLGVWLGDGKSTNPVVYTPEPEIIDWLSEYAREAGCSAKIRPSNKRGTCMSVSLNNGIGKPSPIHGALADAGLLGNKHIPREYLVNSRERRLLLLAGLLDTDGYYSPSGKGYEITQKNEGLARDIKFLADSLGFSATLSSKRAVITSRNFSCTVWRLKIIGDFSSLPMRVERKKPTARIINKDPSVTGLAVEAGGFGEYRGFTLDGDQQFLLEDMTVTHNSSSAETFSRHNAGSGHTVAYIATEYEQEVLDARILQQISGVPMHVILAGGYAKGVRRQLDAAREYYAEKYPTLHYISGSGLNMSQIVGKLHTLRVQPDIVVLDYLQDIAFDREDRGDQTARGNNGMRLFHSALKSIGAAGFVVSQFTKVGHAVKHPNELSRALLNLGNPAIAKSQCTIIAYRNELESDNSDLVWDKNGVPLSSEYGRGLRGEQSRIIQVKIDKQTLGKPGFCFLGFTDNQNIVDLPPRVVEYLGGRVVTRDPEPGEKTLMADGY